jgi:phage gp29-like protein
LPVRKTPQKPTTATEEGRYLYGANPSAEQINAALYGGPAPAAGVSISTAQSIVEAANHWRDLLNPLRGLDITRCIALREFYDRGMMADTQWAFRAIERSDPDLIALIERRMAAILEMEWLIKRVESGRPGFSQDLADRQVQALKAAYSNIGNLYAAVEHLAMAAFRGYAHVEILPDELRPVDQWNIVRNGSQGSWAYNPRALQTTFLSLGPESELDPERFVIMTAPRPIDFYALPKFARCGLGEKDWTAFVEIYGIPSGIVIMPPNIPTGKEDEFASKARAIAEGSSGAIPNGGDFRSNDAPRGVNPFRSYLDYWTEKLVLAGTGGLLTMLAQSGSGTLAGAAHTDTFRQIARGHARRISEALQKQFDARLIEAQFPGAPVLAYFTLDFRGQAETGAVVADVVKLAAQGYRVKPQQVQTRTGYKVVDTSMNSKR